jgi:hypothetical protein
MDPDALWKMLCESLQDLKKAPDNPDTRRHAIDCLNVLAKWLYMDLRKQVADFERSIKPMGNVIPIGQLICMALRYTSDQKGYPQPTLQSLENQSLFAPFWLITKEVVCGRMSR